VASWDTIKSNLFTHLNNGVSVPIAWPNTPFTMPQGQVWIRPNFLQVDNFNIVVDKQVKRKTGILLIQVFAPLNKGDQEAISMVDQLDTLFTNQRINYTVCESAVPRHIGDEGNGWYQINVNIDFWHDDSCE
jgi:hypothetical protein